MAAAAAAAADLIDLSKINVQQFSFRKPLINYIFENSSLILSQKFIKCCKFFKFLHLKMNESQLDRFELFKESCILQSGLIDLEYFPVPVKRFFYFFHLNFHKIKITHQSKIDTTMKSIKILDSCILHSLEFRYNENLMSKLDLSKVKTMVICAKIELEFEILEKFLPPTLEYLDLNCSSCKNANPAFLAFQRCPKAQNITLRIISNPAPPLITKKIFKGMVKTKREIKIVRLGLKFVTETMDKNDFIELLDNHLAPNSYAHFQPSEDKVFNELKNLFILIEKEEQKKRGENEKINIRLFFNGENFDIRL